MLLALAFLITASASAEPGKGEGPPDFPVTVTNDESNPVVVSGDVTADVSGSVDVSSVPETLTGRLDLVLDELEDLNDAVQATSQPRAGYAEYVRFNQNANNCSLCDPRPPQKSLSQPLWASFITVNTENDDGFIEFFNEFGAEIPVLRFGHRNRQLPGVITATLPQAIKISSYSFYCGNQLEDCEVAISLIGDLAQ
jgi:hypothetical protein